ncbi:hypothetical protein BJ875DRAFT_224178 [Amylocarpus encephaloides]|uniref:Uncharacterized protein n=1 Tax=Amylocarpus encephaloides TaxID=45428 RepID=A0A9P7Y7X5_9HELO|nr:hypothetical protein BJ875DRAFT_224178 [Amylocarpus encephaloides]
MARRASLKTTSSMAPNVTPYRDTSNNLQYTSLPNPSPHSPAFPHQPISSSLDYDSDAEPLIPASAHILVPTNDLDSEAIERFTATGRPMPVFKHSNFASMATDMYSLPQLLPRRYTDDSVIPAIICNVIPGSPSNPSDAPESNPPVQECEAGGGKRRSSILGKLRRKSSENSGAKGEKGLTKVVYMPRREYMKYFARGLKGEYIGTEPFRRWSEGELEREFGKWQPEVKKGRRARGL